MEPENRFARSADEVRQLWETHTYAVAGIRTADGKLKALPKESFDAYKKEAELVLIEADGSRQLPCKAPRFHEPVLLPECDTVLGVFGLKSIGMPLETVCFAPEEAKRLLSICECGHTMTPEDGVRLLSSLSGGRKNVGNRTYYAMLHQCDVPHGMEYGLEMLNTLEKNEISSFLSCIK